MTTTNKSFNFSGTNITMVATPVKEDTDASYMEMLDEFICDQKDLIHKDIKGWGIVSGHYFRGDPDAPRHKQKKTPMVYIKYLHSC
tara:strand:+ start:605 stop:862 length:258 start_codon:yes stop_codon:yes gene_type:complete